MEQIDIIALLLILRKRFWLIVIFAAAFAAISGLICLYIVEPEYETCTTLVNNYANAFMNQKLFPTYREIAKSKMASKELRSKLGFSLTDEELYKKIDVTIVTGTEIIKITARDKDGEIAALIANEIAGAFTNNIYNVIKIKNIQVLDKAEVPLKPYKPKSFIIMAIASVLGGMIGIIFLFVYEYFDNTIKSSDDIGRNLALPIIGVIPKITSI